MTNLINKNIISLHRIKKGNTRQIPEIEHPTEFFMEHVPGCRNIMLALCAGIGVKPITDINKNHFL